MDAKKNFQDFSDRVGLEPDATVNPECPDVTEVPDVTGDFFFSSRQAGSNFDFYFLHTLVYTRNPDGTGVVNVSAQPLNYRNLMLAGTPLTATAVPVDACGRFSAHLAGILPGEANPITMREIDVDAQMVTEIRTANFICGRLTGTVLGGAAQLDATFGAQRVPPGTSGNDLPDPIITCEGAMTQMDAGVDAPPPPPPDAAPDAPPASP